MMEGTRYDLTEKAQAIMRLHNSANSYFAANGQGGMFSPGTPPMPMNGEDEPRLFQYQPGINLVTTPRTGYGVLPFGVLRALGSACKEIRLNIELIKRQVRGLEWEIVPNKRFPNPVAYGVEKTVEMQSVVDFFEFPDGVNDFDAWLNMLIEELLVTDAVTLYPKHDLLGGRFTLEMIDGTTIRTLVDMHGRTPRPPEPAYIQMLYGIPSTHYPATELIYRPLNTKVYTPYGESPIEWVLTMINTAIRNDAQRIGYYTEGNIPAAFGFLPDSWTPEQIEIWSQYFDAMLKGDVNRANKIIWLPGGNGAANPVYPFMQNDVDKIDVDKYLMQIACWAFGNSPAEFGIVPGEGLGGKGFMQGSENMQYRSMFWPITGYLHSLFNMIVRRYLKRPDLKFQWIGLDPVPDKMQMAQVDQVYVGMGAYSLGYVQDRLGVPQNFRPVNPPVRGFGEDIGAYGGGNPYFARAVKADLATWREKAERAVKKGWNLPGFESEVIPGEMGRLVSRQLEKAGSVEEVRQVFEQAGAMVEEQKRWLGKDGQTEPGENKGGAGRGIASPLRARGEKKDQAGAVTGEVDGEDGFFRYP